jgi:hypothetical protein
MSKLYFRKSFNNKRGHPKFIRLKNELKVSWRDVFGIMESMWEWCAKTRPAGVLSDEDLEVICSDECANVSECSWQEFRDTLVRVRFLDLLPATDNGPALYQLHNWFIYTTDQRRLDDEDPEVQRKREADRRRQAARRERVRNVIQEFEQFKYRAKKGVKYQSDEPEILAPAAAEKGPEIAPENRPEIPPEFNNGPVSHAESRVTNDPENSVTVTRDVTRDSRTLQRDENVTPLRDQMSHPGESLIDNELDAKNVTPRDVTRRVRDSRTEEKRREKRRGEHLLLNVSLPNDGRETEEGGGWLENAEPPAGLVTFLEPGKIETHQQCIELFVSLFKKNTGNDLPKRAVGYLARVIGRAHRPRKDGDPVAYAAIAGAIANWFASTWTDVRLKYHFAVSEFETRVPQLLNGPLNEYDPRKYGDRRTKEHVEGDFKQYNEERDGDRFTPDFTNG